MTSSTMARHRAKRRHAAREFQQRKLERLLQGEDLSLDEVARVIEELPVLRERVLDLAARGGLRPATVVEVLRRLGLRPVLPLLR